MSLLIKLPEEIKDLHEKEGRKFLDEVVVIAKRAGIKEREIDWRGWFLKRLQAEKASAWFREQELLGQIEGLKRQIR